MCESDVSAAWQRRFIVVWRPAGCRSRGVRAATRWLFCRPGMPGTRRKHFGNDAGARMPAVLCRAPLVLYCAALLAPLWRGYFAETDRAASRLDLPLGPQGRPGSRRAAAGRRRRLVAALQHAHGTGSHQSLVAGGRCRLDRG